VRGDVAKGILVSLFHGVVMSLFASEELLNLGTQAPLLFFEDFEMFFNMNLSLQCCLFNNGRFHFHSGNDGGFEVLVLDVILDLFVNKGLSLLMNDFFCLLVDNFLFFLMDDWLMNFMDMFLMDDWLMDFMNNRLMMFVDDVLVNFSDNILVMFVEHVLMVLFDDGCCYVLLDNGG